MVIDIANQYVTKMDYQEKQQLIETIFVFSPDNKTIESIRKEYENAGFNRKVKNIIQNDETEISYIQVNYQEHTVSAFRSITSHYEIFYSQIKSSIADSKETRELIITDHIINMLGYIPVSERRVYLEGVCDVFLYQHSYGKDTYIKDVYRLGCGEELSFREQKLSVKNVQMLELGKYDLKKENGAVVLERSLREACEKMQKKESINTLSGGVDSTLTHIIMGNPASVSGSYEYEKFLCEKEYAQEAAGLLHANHTVYNISLNDYMAHMVKTVKHYGLSVYNMTAQIIHHVLAENVKANHMFVSELAGAVYGLELRTPYTEKAARKYDFSSPYNYANVNSMIAAWNDVKWIEKVFGKDLVEGQLKKRNEYVLNRLKGFHTSDISRDNYLQLGHLMYYYSNNGVGILEQTEMVFGKTISALFSARKVVEEFLSLDLHERYENEKYGEKPYAKELLNKLLPAYEVNKKKLGGSLPRTWMVTEGPMAGYFNEHDIPDFVDKSLYKMFLEPSWETSWCAKYLIMYSVWYENVMCHEVEKIPSKFKIEW